MAIAEVAARGGAVKPPWVLGRVLVDAVAEAIRDTESLARGLVECESGVRVRYHQDGKFVQASITVIPYVWWA